jgi:hypothetical protein
MEARSSERAIRPRRITEGEQSPPVSPRIGELLMDDLRVVPLLLKRKQDRDQTQKLRSEAGEARARFAGGLIVAKLKTGSS